MKILFNCLLSSRCFPDKRCKGFNLIKSSSNNLEIILFFLFLFDQLLSSEASVNVSPHLPKITFFTYNTIWNRIKVIVLSHEFSSKIIYIRTKFFFSRKNLVINLIKSWLKVRLFIHNSFSSQIYFIESKLNNC